MGKVLFSQVSVCPHQGGGTYLRLGGGLPTLDRGKGPALDGGWVPNLDQSGGVPTLDRGSGSHLKWGYVPWTGWRVSLPWMGGGDTYLTFQMFNFFYWNH